jgi:hypothetical protein
LSALIGVINGAVQAMQPLRDNAKLVEVAFQALVVQMIAVRAQNLVSTFTQITGGLVAMTRSVIASTAATRALATAQATGSRSGLLLAQNLAAQGAAARTAIQGFAGAAAAGAQFALLAGAIASVSVALSRFKDGGAALNEGADDIRKSLAEVQLELQGTSSQAAATRQGLLELFPADPPPTDFLDKITEKLVQIRERIDGIIKSVPGMQQALLLVPGANVALNLLPDTTNAEKQLNDQKIALENILTATDEVIRSTEQFGTTGVNATGQYVSSQKQAQTQLEAINATLLGLQRQQEGLDPATLGADAYQQFTTQINASIKALEQEKLEFQRRFDLVDSYQDLVTQNAKALQKIETDSLNAQAKLVEAGEPQTRILQVEADALNKRVAQNRVYADKLKTAIEAGILDPKEVQQAQLEIESIERDSADARLAIANKQKEIAQAVSDALADSAEEQKKSLEGLTAANQKALSDLELAAANTRATILEAGGDPAKLAQAEQQALKDRIDANKDFLAQLKELTPAEGEDAQKTADQIRQVELTLANDRVALAQQVLEAKVKAAEEVAKAEVDRLKEVRDAEKAAAEQDFERQQTAKSDQFAEEERSRQDAFNQSQQDQQKAFNESQRQADKAFQQQQQAEAQRFQDQLDAKRNRGNREFDVLQREVDRRAQLAAATGAERADLQRQFDEEDRRAKERRKIEQQVLNQRGSVLAGQGDLLELSPLEQARAEFENRLQEEQKVFQEQQQLEQEAFEAQQQQQQEEFELIQRDAQRAFDDEQRTIERAFQAEQQAAEAAFNAQQRQLDEQSAQRQAAILEAASRGIAPQVRARRDGGPVAAGQPYLVGEEGPELITPTRRGWVHTAGETAAIMARQPVMAIKPQAMAGVEAKLSELLQEVRQGRRVVAPTSFTLNTQNPLSDAVELQIKQVRALARGRVL